MKGEKSSVDVHGKVSSYILEETIINKPLNLIEAIKAALADHLACSIAGSEAKVTSIVKQFAKTQWGKGDCALLLDHQKLTAAGASFVNATMANALDLDDGHRLTKGHPGAVIIPAVMAAAEEMKCTGKEFMDAVLVGYEIGIRAAIIAHQNRPEYHCTGSWGAMGAAAGVSRILGLTKEEVGHALGIAEYHSTYSPMMRCIDRPSMLKDGIAWGSMTGLSSAYLAKLQFTGIPSLFLTSPSNELVEELGEFDRIHELYYKPYACCRWAQPAIECMKELLGDSKISIADVDRIIVYTFTESARLSQQPPNNTEEAQYNLLFPIAAYFVFGEVGPKQILNELQNRDVLDLMTKIKPVIDERFNSAFPAKARSQIEIHTITGEVVRSSVKQAKGDYDFPLTIAEKRVKFFNLTTPIIGEKKSSSLLETIEHLETLESIDHLLSIANE